MHDKLVRLQFLRAHFNVAALFLVGNAVAPEGTQFKRQPRKRVSLTRNRRGMNLHAHRRIMRDLINLRAKLRLIPGPPSAQCAANLPVRSERRIHRIGRPVSRQ